MHVCDVTKLPTQPSGSCNFSTNSDRKDKIKGKLGERLGPAHLYPGTPEQEMSWSSDIS